MSAYAIACLHNVKLGSEIKAYLQAIDETMRPYAGRFLVHGGAKTELEGQWPGDLIIIAFPDMDQARAWYHSDGYQEILPLRTRNSIGVALLIEGVPEDYSAISKLAVLGL